MLGDSFKNHETPETRYDTERFLAMVTQNHTLVTLLDRLPHLQLPNWYLTGGAVFQTVWNVLEGRNPTSAIKDYDVFYFDSADLSYEAEDRHINQARQLLADFPGQVELRNEARVHLWYEEKFGRPCAPFASSEDAIDHFIAPVCCYGLTTDDRGTLQVYAPHGYDDLFSMTIRPQDVLAPPEVYTTKTADWRQRWPSLTVLPWIEPNA